MDSDEIRYFLGESIHLKYYFYGIFATDNFPKLTIEGFIIVSASPSQHAGSHCIVRLFLKSQVYLADPLGISIRNYRFLYCRLVKPYNELTQKLKANSKSTQNSVDFLCIYIAHVMFGYEYPLMLNLSDNDMLRFAKYIV